MSEQVSIIIVNWNAGVQLVDVLASIVRYHSNVVSSVIVVDNGSVDGSLKPIQLMKDLPFQLNIVRNKENKGFAVACNQGAALASSEYILFLNPDARLFENSLSVPLAFMEAANNRGVGVVGIQLIDEHSSISRSCARFPTLGMFAAQAFGLNRLPGLRHLNMHLTDWSHTETRTVDHVIGAFYLLRRSLFNSLRGFDEHFFVYLEDLDLSLRIRQEGYSCIYLTDAQAFHSGGGTSSQVKARRLFYSLRSRLIYGYKHFPRTSAWGLLFITLVIEPVSRLALALWKGSKKDFFQTLQAYALLIKSLSEVLLFSRR